VSKIKTVSPKLNNLEELFIKVAEQLLTFTKTVSPELNNLEELPIKNAEQLLTFIKSPYLN
jgi:hypothetical protein